MPVHDWTRVEAGIFHDFHSAWIPELRKALNRGLLPEGYYALAEQHAGRLIPDVLTLHESPAGESEPSFSNVAGTPGTAVAEAPPKVRHHFTLEHVSLTRRRTLAIRHVSGHRLIAMIEILSPANKDRTAAIDDFAAKAVDALDAGVHLLLVDLFPPGAFDPQGMHAIIRHRLENLDASYDLPKEEPLTLASYAAGRDVEIYIEQLAVGANLAEMPLFLRSDRYINVPLEATYQEAYQGMPSFWQDFLEGRKK